MTLYSGQYCLTELGYGLDVVNMETRASLLPDGSFEQLTLLQSEFLFSSVSNLAYSLRGTCLLPHPLVTSPLPSFTHVSLSMTKTGVSKSSWPSFMMEEGWVQELYQSQSPPFSCCVNLHYSQSTGSKRFSTTSETLPHLFQSCTSSCDGFAQWPPQVESASGGIF